VLGDGDALFGKGASPPFARGHLGGLAQLGQGARQTATGVSEIGEFGAGRQVRQPCRGRPGGVHRRQGGLDAVHSAAVDDQDGDEQSQRAAGEGVEGPAPQQLAGGLLVRELGDQQGHLDDADLPEPVTAADRRLGGDLEEQDGQYEGE